MRNISYIIKQDSTSDENYFSTNILHLIPTKNIHDNKDLRI